MLLAYFWAVCIFINLIGTTITVWSVDLQLVRGWVSFILISLGLVLAGPLTLLICVGGAIGSKLPKAKDKHSVISRIHQSVPPPEIIEVKAAKYPSGKYIVEDEFTTYPVPLNAVERNLDATLIVWPGAKYG